MGAALRAAHGWLCNKKGSFIPISVMYKGKLEKSAMGCKLSTPAGNKELFSKYTFLMKKRIEIEVQLLKNLGRV